MEVAVAVQAVIQDLLHQVVEIQVHQNKRFYIHEITKIQKTDKKGREILICLEVKKENYKKI